MAAAASGRWLLVGGLVATATACLSDRGLAGVDLSGSTIVTSPANLPLAPAAAAQVAVHLARADGSPWGGAETRLTAPGCTVTPAGSQSTSGGGDADFVVSCDRARVVAVTAELIIAGLSTVAPATAAVNFYSASDGAAGVYPGSRLCMQAAAPGDGGGIDHRWQGGIHFTSTDPEARLPADGVLAASDAGVRTFVGEVILNTLGQQRVTAVDPGTKLLLGELDVLVSRGEGRVGFDTEQATTVAGEALPVVLLGLREDGSFDPSYGHQVVLKSSDSAATLPLPMQFLAALQGRLSLPREVVFRTAGQQKLTAFDRQTGRSSTLAVAVEPAAASALKVSVAGPVAAGDAADLGVEVADAFANRVSTFVGTVELAGDDGRAVLPGTLALAAADAGRVFLPRAVVPARAGLLRVTAMVQGTPQVGGQAQIGVVPGPAAALRLQTADSGTAGVPASLMVQALDRFGNLSVNYRGTVQFSASSPRTVVPGTSFFAAAYAGALGLGNGVVIADAGIETLVVVDVNDGSLRASAQVSVVPGPLDHFASGLPAQLIAGRSYDLALAASDAQGNLIADYTGALALQQNDPNGSLRPAATSVLLAAGDHGHTLRPAALVMKTAGDHQLTIVDAARSLTTTVTCRVLPGPANAIQISSLPATTTRTQPLSPRLRVVDSYGNTVTTFVGTIDLTVTGGGGARFPSHVDLGPQDQGDSRERLAHQLVFDEVGAFGVRAQAAISGISGQASVTSRHGCFRFGDPPVANLESVMTRGDQWDGTIDPNGWPQVTWVNLHQRPYSPANVDQPSRDVAGWDGQGWSRLGANPRLFTDSRVGWGKIKPDAMGRPALATNNGGYSTIFLAYFDSGQWRDWGRSDSDGVFAGDSFDFAFDAAGWPWLAATIPASGATRVGLRAFDGAAWGAPGGTAQLGFSGNNANPQVAFDGAGTPYVAWVGDATGNLDIYVASGAQAQSLGIWQGPAGAATADNVSNTVGASREFSLAVDQENRPIVAWSDDITGVSQIYLRRFDGAGWTEMAASASYDGISSQPGGAVNPQVAVDSRNWPVVTWVSTASSTLMMRRYNGESWAEEYGSASGGGMDSLYPSVSGLYNSRLFMDAVDRAVVIYNKGTMQVCSWR